MQGRTEDGISTGSGLTGAGGALLVIFFFMPWLTACGLNFSGKDLATGIDVGFGMTSAAAYPWLIILPLLGALTTLLVILSILGRNETSRTYPNVTLAAGVIALIVLVFIGLSFASEIDMASQALIGIKVQIGYPGSILAAVLIIVGSQFERRTVRASDGISAARRSSRPAMAPAAPPSLPPARAHTPIIRVIYGPGSGQSAPIRGEFLTVGRGTDCDLQLRDPTVSRQHARIRYAAGSWFIQDQESARGLLVNGRRVSAARLNSGDEIQIGDTKLRFDA